MLIFVKVIYLFLVIITAAGIIVPSAFAQEQIHVEVYRDAAPTQLYEKFMITGWANVESPREVQLKIYDPNGNLVYSPTIPIEVNGEFSDVARVESSWVTNGVYTIEVEHEDLIEKAQTKIQFSKGDSMVLSPTGSSGSTIDVSGFNVEYSPGATISSSMLNTSFKTITFNISDLSENQIWINLPNDLISNPNAVWVNQEQIYNFDTIILDDMTRLVIPVNANTDEIVVMGSSVVPEFGSITAIILGFAIFVTIILSTKTKSFSFSRF